MNNSLYTELRKLNNEDERLRFVMMEIRNMMESKKKKSITRKLLNKKPKTQPNGW